MNSPQIVGNNSIVAEEPASSSFHMDTDGPESTLTLVADEVLTEYHNRKWAETSGLILRYGFDWKQLLIDHPRAPPLSRFVRNAEQQIIEPVRRAMGKQWKLASAPRRRKTQSTATAPHHMVTRSKVLEDDINLPKSVLSPAAGQSLLSLTASEQAPRKPLCIIIPGTSDPHRAPSTHERDNTENFNLEAGPSGPSRKRKRQ